MLTLNLGRSDSYDANAFVEAVSLIQVDNRMNDTASTHIKSHI